ncbi:MAG: hypothetical protein AB3N14_05380, partial [Flavobacteriaceae bacterium]
IAVKYSHLLSYQRVHYSPLQQYRYGATVGDHLFRVFQETHETNSNEVVFKRCVTIENLEAPDLDWLASKHPQNKEFKALYNLL